VKPMMEQELEHIPSRRLSTLSTTTSHSASSHSASSPPYVQRIYKKNPKPPCPDADPLEVHHFFKEVILANRINIDEAQAAEVARKLQVNGDGLYRLDKEQFVKAFEAQGAIIYDLVLHGKWGYVCKF